MAEKDKDVRERKLRTWEVLLLLSLFVVGLIIIIFNINGNLSITEEFGVRTSGADLDYNYVEMDYFNSNDYPIANATLKNLYNSGTNLYATKCDFIQSWNGSYYTTSDVHLNMMRIVQKNSYVWAINSFFEWRHYDTTGRGIGTRETYALTGNRNISWSFNFWYQNTDYQAGYNIRSYITSAGGNVNVVRITVTDYDNLLLEYHDGSYHTLDTINPYRYSWLNFSVNYAGGTAKGVLTLWINNTYYDTWNFANYQNNPTTITGFSHLAFDPLNDGDFEFVICDYVSIYDDGEYVDSDYGSFEFEITDNIEEVGGLFYNYQMYSISCNSSFNNPVYLSDYSYGLDSFRFKWFNDNLTYRYLGDIIGEDDDEYISASRYVIRVIVNQSYPIANWSYANIDVYGLGLKQSTNYYFPQIKASNIDLNNSYNRLWISNNYLRFNFTFVTDDSPEYLDIDFDIADIITLNRSFSFDSQYNGIGEGNCRVNFTDDTTIIWELKGYSQQINQILPQSKIITGVYYLLSDNNINSFTNYTITGRFSGITLMYITNIGVTITTYNFVTLIVPLIVMFVPTLILAKKYGSSIIVPMLIIMSTILVITNILPIWLYFIIVLGLGLTVFIKYRGGSRHGV